MLNELTSLSIVHCVASNRKPVLNDLGVPKKKKREFLYILASEQNNSRTRRKVVLKGEPFPLKPQGSNTREGGGRTAVVLK